MLSCWYLICRALFYTTNPWFKKPINDLFVGEHIGYDVESCKMVSYDLKNLLVCSLENVIWLIQIRSRFEQLIAPYQENDKSWVLYIFDRFGKKLHVLDPVRSCLGPISVEEHHLARCSVLINGLAMCFKTYFEGIEIDTNGWEYIFHPNLNAMATMWVHFNIYIVYNFWLHMWFF